MERDRFRYFRLIRRYAELIPLAIRDPRPEDLARIEALIRDQFPSIRQISTQSLADWLADGGRTPPVLVDVRSKEEFAVSHLKHAASIASRKEERKRMEDADREAPVVLYCSVGWRSSVAAVRWQKAGYVNVFNLEGSIFRWANEGRCLYRGNAEVSEVHPYATRWSKLLSGR